MKRKTWRFLERLFGRRPPAGKLGLALSGGGVRGLAHIGVLKVLEHENIPVHFLAGTSAGGLIAAGYAAGLTASDLEKEALRMSSPRQMISLVNRSLPWRGLLAGQRVVDYLTPLLGGRTFDELRTPLAVIAVDLNEGRKMVLREGPVLDAVLATIALPGLLAPVERGGQLLVDGGLLDNLPASEVRQMGADVVLAVDISTDKATMASMAEELHRRRFVPDGLADLMEVLWRSVTVMTEEINRRNLEEAHPDLLVRPVIPSGVTVVTGFTRAAEIIAAGEQAAREAVPRLKNLLGMTDGA